MAFLRNNLQIKAKEIYSVLFQNSKQNVNISFIKEISVIALEEKITAGMLFPRNWCQGWRFQGGQAHCYSHDSWGAPLGS